MKCQNLFSGRQFLETICIKCQNLFSGKCKKNIVNLWSAELAQNGLFHSKPQVLECANNELVLKQKQMLSRLYRLVWVLTLNVPNATVADDIFNFFFFFFFLFFKEIAKHAIHIK